MSRLVSFSAFAAVAFIAWAVFVPLYSLCFGWAEFVPGINWIYLPHGLRVVLALLFGIPGVIGFTAAASALSWTLLPPPAPLGIAEHLSLSAVPALAVFGAVRLARRDSPSSRDRSKISPPHSRLDGRQLLLLAFASAVLNSAGHAAVWQIFEPSGPSVIERYVAMFVGDLLGATVLLYLFRLIVILTERVMGRSKSHET